jgi:hypothetical protein
MAVASTRPVARPVSPGPQPGGTSRARFRSPRPPSRNVLPSPPSVALLPLGLVAAIVAWWGLKEGAYFGVVFLPGAMILLCLLAALLVFAPWPASLRGPARLSLLGLFALAGWTLLSTLWSPMPDVAVADAQRVLGYTVAFALGLWLSLLLGRRMLLALTPLAVAGALVAVVSLIVLWTGTDAQEYLETDATLRYPLGYRNAAAAFFIMAVWPLLVLAASRDLDWKIRGLMGAAATLCIELAVLAQSRGAVLAVVVGAAALVAVHPARLRILGWLALAAAPGAAALPWLLDVFQAGGENTSASIPPLHAACRAMAATTAVSAVVCLLAARAGMRVQLSSGARRVIGRGLLAYLAIALLAGGVALARSDGGPTGFVDRYGDELTAGTPDLTSQGSRFGFDLRSNRGDFWRVAWDDFTANPAEGTGAGGFRPSYLLDRDLNTVDPEDPHSVELLMAGELGIVGLLLFAAFFGGAVAAALRARRLGPSAAALAAGAIAIAAYWLMHASVEWFWSYPAITLPVAFALGAAAAPALLRPGRDGRRAGKMVLAALAVVAALSMVPFLLSERWTNDALGNPDINEAYAEIEDAADLNPASVRALAAEAVIAEAAGDRQRALAALDRAEKRIQEEWTLYYLEARVLAPIDPAGAARALAEAKALNPRGTEVDELAVQLGITL